MNNGISRRDYLLMLILSGSAAWLTVDRDTVFAQQFQPGGHGRGRNWRRQLEMAIRSGNTLEPCTVRLPYASRVRWYIRRGYRHCDSNDIPDHKVGRFPDRGNPNHIRPQDFHFQMTTRPRPAPQLIALQNHIDFGVGLDGVPFDPGTALFWENKRHSIWNYALLTGFGNLGLDASHAHVQFDGTYHYHGVPTQLIKHLHGWGKVTLVGYAADGFPIYGPWGYAAANNPRSTVRVLRSSYRMKSGRRPDPPNGPGGRYTGMYTGDWEFVPGHGDLDAANGRFGVTPEYPGGTYYYVTSYQFPFIPRYFRGTPDRSFYKTPPQGGRRHRPGPGDGGFGPGRPFGPGGG